MRVSAHARICDLNSSQVPLAGMVAIGIDGFLPLDSTSRIVSARLKKIISDTFVLANHCGPHKSIANSPHMAENNPNAIACVSEEGTRPIAFRPNEKRRTSSQQKTENPKSPIFHQM